MNQGVHFSSGLSPSPCACLHLSITTSGCVYWERQMKTCTQWLLPQKSVSYSPMWFSYSEQFNIRDDNIAIAISLLLADCDWNFTESQKGLSWQGPWSPSNSTPAPMGRDTSTRPGWSKPQCCPWCPWPDLIAFGFPKLIPGCLDKPPVFLPGYLSLLPPSIGFLYFLVFDFVWEFLFHPCMPLCIFAWLTICWDASLLNLEEVPYVKYMYHDVCLYAWCTWKKE